MSNVVDISALGNLEPVAPIDLSVIPEAPKKAFSFPKSGVYTVVAPEVIPAEAFGKTQAGNLSARVDPKIAGPSNEGYEIRFTNLSAKVYQDPRTGLDTSQVAQYLQAFGITEELDGTPQQAANLIASTAGQTAEVYADWVAEHRPTKFKLSGMKNFPSDGNGGFTPYVEHPDSSVTDAEGKALRLRANLVIKRWIARKPS